MKNGNIVWKMDFNKRKWIILDERMGGVGDIGGKECQKLTFTKSAK